ncbi:hypothetical protein D9M68_766890 [compost metagenome]
MRARHRVAHVLEQRQRELEFAVGEGMPLRRGVVARGRVDQHALRHPFELPAAEALAVGRRERHAPGHQALHAGAQFERSEGFDDVVVGAEVQCLHHVVLGSTRAQHEHRHLVGLPLAQPLQQFDAGQAGHVPVEHQQIEAFAPQCLLQGRPVRKRDAGHIRLANC